MHRFTYGVLDSSDAPWKLTMTSMRYSRSKKTRYTTYEWYVSGARDPVHVTIEHFVKDCSFDEPELWDDESIWCKIAITAKYVKNASNWDFPLDQAIWSAFEMYKRAMVATQAKLLRSLTQTVYEKTGVFINFA